jgi:oxygen-independent coproporphyrinogen-3 oxidase
MEAEALPTDELVRKYDYPVPRYTSYPAATQWDEHIDAGDYAQGLADATGRDTPLSVYVHVPFCRSLCSYCGCNVVVGREHSEADAYLALVAEEMRHVAVAIGSNRRISQLHWGGGTPNFLTEEQIQRLWGALAQHWAFEPDAEAAIEVNPATCTESQLECLRSLGFNRVSFGVQDLDPHVQRAVLRANVGPRLSRLMDKARALGFRGINFDLIYGLPEQTPERWERTLDRVLEVGPDRVACYAFAFLPDSLPHQRTLDAKAIPSGSAKLGLFRRAYARMLDAGYSAIGMDHFARQDDELALAQRRHTLRRNFQGYTQSSATDVVAFGASAISDVGGLYAQNARELDAYGAAVRQGSFATRRGMKLTEDDVRRRRVIEQLMCNFQIPLGGDARYFASELEHLRAFEADGLVRVGQDEVQVSPLGRFFVRQVAQVFDRYSVPARRAAAGV